jgi:hypothetical protein
MTTPEERAAALAIVPITLREANAFIARHHRHHRPAQDWMFGVAVAKGSAVVGVCVVGHPVARRLHDGWTLEVRRTCTDSTPNANSMLYGAAWRAAKALGYRRLLTYTLPTESGVSLRAAGWRLIGAAGGGKWSRPSRPRVDLHPTQEKLRWEAQ